MTYNYFNELKNSFEKCAYDHSGYGDSGDGLAGVEDALAAATGATADVGRVADTVEETGGAVQKSLDELTPAATGALDALKWAPAALAGIPTAGYLLHQYLRGNYDDKKKKEKEAAYLGKRAMEKAGQRWISKLNPFGAPKGSGVSGLLGENVVAGAGALGAGSYMHSEGYSPEQTAIGGLGTLGLLSPMTGRVLGRLGEKKYGAPELGRMDPKNVDARMFGRAMGYPLVIGGKMLMIPAAGLLEASRKGTEGWAHQMEASPDVILSSFNADGEPTELRVPGSFLQDFGGGQAAVAADQRSRYEKFKDSAWYRMIKNQQEGGDKYKGRVKVTPVPTLVQGGQEAVKELKDTAADLATGAEAGSKFVTDAAPRLTNVATALEPATQELSSGLKSQSYEARKWREGLSGAVRKAAPVGAGALGGYILSQLLGPGVRKNETPSEREKRERLQRIYSLLGTTGGGALGYYLSNRLGGAGAGANTKTGGDVKSFKTIARLGRASA